MDLVKLIQENLTNDLLKPKYRGIKRKYFGHCYVATECFYYIYGRWNGWFPYCHRNRKGETHWWLQNGNEILDITAEQFDKPYQYDKGHRQFFVSYPSKRCKILTERVKRCLIKFET
jgi:hypothetical protein